MTHRDRLIAAGLFTPLSASQICRRNDILFQLKQGVKVYEAPTHCVFRRDAPNRHVQLPGPLECQQAELIEQRLFSYEAHRLCDQLNRRDPEQPPRPNPALPPIGMYGICSMDDWADWEQRHAQLRLEV